MPRPKGSKNKPGAGRPKLGRTVNLPRITVAAHALLKAHADRTGKGIAATIEGLIKHTSDNGTRLESIGICPECYEAILECVCQAGQR